MSGRCMVPVPECCGGCDHATPDEAWLAEQLGWLGDTREMDRLERRARPRLRYRALLMPPSYWSRAARDGMPF